MFYILFIVSKTSGWAFWSILTRVVNLHSYYCKTSLYLFYLCLGLKFEAMFLWDNWILWYVFKCSAFLFNLDGILWAMTFKKPCQCESIVISSPFLLETLLLEQPLLLIELLWVLLFFPLQNISFFCTFNKIFKQKKENLWKLSPKLFLLLVRNVSGKTWGNP